jgi:hypothetical protein
MTQWTATVTGGTDESGGTASQRPRRDVVRPGGPPAAGGNPQHRHRGAIGVAAPAVRPKLRRCVGCKWLVTCEDFAESAEGRSQKDQGQGRP